MRYSVNYNNIETAYYLTKNNAIVTNFAIADAFLICRGIVLNPTPENIDKKMYGLAGIKCKIENPTVEMFVRNGSRYDAITFYIKHIKDTENRDIGWKEAADYVTAIENKLKN